MMWWVAGLVLCFIIAFKIRNDIVKARKNPYRPGG